MSNNTSPEAIWDRELAAVVDLADDWLWQGLIAKGNITLLTSLWKSGKTTLLAHLLAQRKQGGKLAGLPVLPGKTIVITEEPRALWAQRARAHDFGGHVCFFPQPFNHLPEPAERRALLERIGRLGAEHGTDLVVVDTLTHFLRVENTSRGILDALLPLRALTRQGMAGLVLHHPSKGKPAEGQAGRGHGALHSHVDISIEMRRAGDSPDSRARRFYCLSRHDATPPHLLFQLSADGKEYLPLPDAADEEFHRQWDVLRMVLEDASQKLTRHDILGEWPADFARPDPGTLWKWLTRAVGSSLIQVEGSGRKADPFRYWLPATLERWKQNPLYELLEEQNARLKQLFRPLAEVRHVAKNNVDPAWDAPLAPVEHLRPPESPEE